MNTEMKMSVHLPSCYAGILDLLHEDPKLSFLLTPQSNYTKTKAAPLWFEQLKCDNSMHIPYETKPSSAQINYFVKTNVLHNVNPLAY